MLTDTTAPPYNVKIVSEEAAPPVVSVPVIVHFVERGVDKTQTILMRHPTYFDGIAVSVAHKVLSSFPMPQFSLNSVRSAARFGYHVGRLVEAQIRPPIVMEKPVFDTRSWEPNNIAHLLLDLIPYSLYVRKIVGPEVVTLFRELRMPFRQLLEIFDLTPQFERRRIEGDIVKISGTRGLAVYDLDPRSTFDCPGICLVPKVYSGVDFSSSPKFERVFLARRGPRSLLNQTDVERTVARFGYRTVFMEDYSLLEQLSIGAQAKHIVAIHGAAMSFLVMNKQIDSIVELLPANNYAAGFPVSLGSRVKHYEQIIPSFDRDVQHIGWPEIVKFKEIPFAVSVSLIERLLSNIH